MSDELDDFAMPGGSLDDFLAEEIAAQESSTEGLTDEEKEARPAEEVFNEMESTDEEQSELPVVHDFDPAEDRELTLYGAMRLATEAAVDALRGRLLSEQANAFRSYLISFRNELTR